MKYPPTREEYYDLINKVKLLEQQIKQNNDDEDNDTTQEMTKEEKKASKFTKVDVELESIPKDDRKNTLHRNSLTEMYHNNTVRRKSLKLLGEDVVMDDWLDWRVKWGQRGAAIFGLLGMICYILGTAVGNVGLQVAAIIFGILVITCIGILYYNNVSLVIVKRLLTEPNVVIIIILTILNWAIDIGRPATILSPIMGCIYMLVINAFVFMDAIKLKSRLFVIIVGSIYTFLNLREIYDYVFTDYAEGVVLFNYTINGEEHTIMKRSTKRSIFLQVLLFSITAVYTTFKDKKMELMIFATGNIYRKTGTASKDVEDETYSINIKQEKERSTDKARV